MEILKDLVKTDIFLQWNSDKEINITTQLVQAISLKVRCFINTTAVLLHACEQERFEGKSTVFLLHEGNVRLTGKAHRHNDDINECLLLIDVLKIIFNSSIFDYTTEYVYFVGFLFLSQEKLLVTNCLYLYLCLYLYILCFIDF